MGDDLPRDRRPPTWGRPVKNPSRRRQRTPRTRVLSCTCGHRLTTYLRRSASTRTKRRRYAIHPVVFVLPRRCRQRIINDHVHWAPPATLIRREFRTLVQLFCPFFLCTSIRTDGTEFQCWPIQRTQFRDIYKSVQQPVFSCKDSNVIWGDSESSTLFCRSFFGYIQLFLDNTDTTLTISAFVAYPMQFVLPNTSQQKR